MTTNCIICQGEADDMTSGASAMLGVVMCTFIKPDVLIESMCEKHKDQTRQAVVLMALKFQERSGQKKESG